MAAIIDWYSKAVLSCDISNTMNSSLIMQVLNEALYKYVVPEIFNTDQGSQYTSHEWQAFLKEHGLKGSMSRRGNCHDNAVAESFFQLLKRERIRRHIYSTREAARSDVFNYIEMFYNTRRRHGFNNQLSPVEYEAQYQERLVSV